MTDIKILKEVNYIFSFELVLWNPAYSLHCGTSEFEVSLLKCSVATCSHRADSTMNCRSLSEWHEACDKQNRLCFLALGDLIVHMIVKALSFSLFLCDLQMCHFINSCWWLCSNVWPLRFSAKLLWNYPPHICTDQTDVILAARPWRSCEVTTKMVVQKLPLGSSVKSFIPLPQILKGILKE